MIGVALGALTRNTIGAIVAAIAWALFVEQVILNAVVPGIEKWLPTGAAIGLTNAPGSGHFLSPAVAGAVLTGYAVILLLRRTAPPCDATWPDTRRQPMTTTNIPRLTINRQRLAMQP